MNAAPLRTMTLGLLKTSLLCEARRQHPPPQIPSGRRLMAAAAAPSPPTPPSPAPRTKTTKYRRDTSQYAVYTPQLLKPPHKDPLAAHTAYQIRKMDPTGQRARLFSKANPDSARVGDVLMVTTRRSQEPFSGVCISVRRAGVETAFLLRGQLTRVGVEMWYKLYSRSVTGIEIISRRARRARRARLTYMRKPRHDMGSVDNLVRQWRRTRHVFASKGQRRKAAKRTVEF